MDLLKEHWKFNGLWWRERNKNWPADAKSAKDEVDRLVLLIANDEPSEYLQQIKEIYQSDIHLIDILWRIALLLKLALVERRKNKDVFSAYLLFAKLPRNHQDILQCLFREYIGLHWKPYDEGWMEYVD